MSITFIAVLVFTIAVLAAFLLVKRKPGLEKQARWFLFALYFWVVMFVQLIIAALLYSVFRSG